MPNTLSVLPRDVCITIEFTITELRLIQKGLEMSSIAFNGEIDEERKAAEYISEEFSSFIQNLLDELKICE